MNLRSGGDGAGAGGATEVPGAVPRDHVVFLLHGIRTQAEWQERVRKVLEEDPSLRVIPLRYGFFDVIRFLVPMRAARRGPVERVARLLRDQRGRGGTGRTSVVAHSFGTYVVGQLLEHHPDLSFTRLVLSGCILDPGFAWESYPHRFELGSSAEPQVVNDCGYRDVWPVLARTATWGYGPSGRFGFGHPRVRDRFHDRAHSEFFDDAFVARFWRPFLATGEIAEGDAERPVASWLLSLLTIVKLPVVALLALVVAGLTLLAGRTPPSAVGGAEPSIGGRFSPLNCYNERHVCAFQLLVENSGDRPVTLSSLQFEVESFREFETLGGLLDPVPPSDRLGFDLTDLREAGDRSASGALALPVPARGTANLTVCFSAGGRSAPAQWELRARLESVSGPAVEIPNVIVDLPWNRASGRLTDPARIGRPLWADGRGEAGEISCPRLPGSGAEEPGDVS